MLNASQKVPFTLCGTTDQSHNFLVFPDFKVLKQSHILGLPKIYDVVILGNLLITNRFELILQRAYIIDAWQGRKCTSEMEWSSKTKIFFYDDFCFQQLILKNQIKKTVQEIHIRKNLRWRLLSKENLSDSNQ